MSAVAERVAAGAAFLDEHDPDWWRADVERAIELPSLDLSSERSCVLGQRCPLEVMRDYAEREWGDPDTADADDAYMAYAYKLTSAVSMQAVGLWAAEHGFALDLSRGRPPITAWADLTAEWKQVITERRAGTQ